MRNVPHGHVSLNSWSTVGETDYGGDETSGGGAFLGERGSTALGISCSTPALSLSFLSAAFSYPHVSPTMPSLI